MKSASIIWMAAGAVLAGCEWLGDVIVPGYLVNESAATLEVTVTKPGPNDGPDAPVSVCPLGPTREPISIAQASAVYERRFNDWRPATLASYDEESCTATISLPAGSALLMFRNGTCSDYEKYLSNPHLTPTLERLSITGGGRTIVLAGFDIAKAFKASRWRNDCRLVVR